MRAWSRHRKRASMQYRRRLGTGCANGRRSRHFAAHHTFERPVLTRPKVGWERRALCDRIGAIEDDYSVVEIELDAAMRSVLLIVLVAVSGTSRSALAEDAPANFLVKLFATVCIPSVGQADKVRAWATEHHLPEITAPVALDVFVGSGGKGIAWAVPSAVGSFALSVRGTSEACAVWARTAAPTDAETLFRTTLEGAKRPGVDVSIIKDTRDPSPSGVIHTLVYSVSGADKLKGGFLYTMQTVERPGGPFQASLQAARFTAP